jgi:predicted kinase
MSGGRLIILCGLPGSGKSTLARSIEASFGAVRMSPDDWMAALGINLYDEAARAKIEALQWSFAQQLLSRGLIVTIEWGTWGYSERETLRLGARALGCAVELRYLSETYEVLCERIERRGMEDPPISREAVRRWLDLFQVPSAEELALYDAPAAVNAPVRRS